MRQEPPPLSNLPSCEPWCSQRQARDQSIGGQRARRSTGRFPRPVLNCINIYKKHKSGTFIYIDMCTNRIHAGSSYICTRCLEIHSHLVGILVLCPSSRWQRLQGGQACLSSSRGSWLQTTHCSGSQTVCFGQAQRSVALAQTSGWSMF